MTDPVYEILPPDRKWPGDVEACAQALVSGANGRRGELAALSLLFRDPELTIFRVEVIEEYIHALSPVRIDWQTLHGDAELQQLTRNQQSRALVMLACSMASRACRVRLGDLLAVLDHPTRNAFVDAAAYLFANRED